MIRQPRCGRHESVMYSQLPGSPRFLTCPRMLSPRRASTLKVTFALKCERSNERGHTESTGRGAAGHRYGACAVGSTSVRARCAEERVAAEVFH
jgi:hypothetical protein